MEQVSIASAYMWAFVVMVVFFLVAVFVASSIPYRPGNPGTTQRRIWFWILCILTGVVGFVINYIIGSGISVPSTQSSYYTNAVIASAAALALFIVIGLAVSKMFPTSKVGTWF